MTVPTSWLPQQPHEGLQAYGSRILRALLTDDPIAGLLTDDDLELADHIAIYAVSARDISAPALANLSACRHFIARILSVRKAERQTDPTTVPTLRQDRPNEGPMARLETQPIVRPPAGHAIDIPF